MIEKSFSFSVKKLATRTPWVCGNGNRSRYRRSTGLETRDRAGQQRSHSGAGWKESPCLDRRMWDCWAGGCDLVEKEGIPGHDCRGGDGILPCKPSQNVLPSLPSSSNDARYQINTISDSCGKQVGAGVRLSPNASRVICCLGL